MHPAYQPLFVAPGTREALVFRGTRDGSRWVDGELVGPDGRQRFAVQDGVAVFVPPNEHVWSRASVAEIGFTPEWIARLVESYRKGNLDPRLFPPARFEHCRRMAASDQLILELACGPSGGNMPLVLIDNPHSTVLTNDLGHEVLKVWRAHQKQTSLAPNLSFACFDARKIPLKSECIDIISTCAGFTEIICSSGVYLESSAEDSAVREAFRVLKPGGRTYLIESWISCETISQLPESVLRKYNLPLPELPELFEAVGFDVVSVEKGTEFTMPADESELSKAAQEHGVTLQMQMLAIEAVKPQPAPG